MLAYNHLLFGIGSWMGLELAGVSTSLPLPAEIALVCVGALLPDVDHPDSVVGRKVLWLSWPIRIFFGHRGITHSLLAVIFCAWALYSVPSYGFCLAFGYLTHLAGDYLTGGVPLLWPMRRQYRFPLSFSTGGIVEHALVIGAFGSLLAWLLNTR